MPSIQGGQNPTFKGKQGSREKYYQEVQKDIDSQMKKMYPKGQSIPAKAIGNVKPLEKKYRDTDIV